jgi:tRNA(adenine34) deaminase
VSAATREWRRARLARRLASFRPDPAACPDDPLGILVCEEALAASVAGNYGVGALLANDGGEVLLRGGNQVFHPRFASDGHAEMALVSRLEREHPEVAPASLTLVVSLEPCPMCYARLKLAGIGRVLYLAADEAGGMVRRAAAMPPIWAYLHPGQSFAPARVSPRLRRLALAIFRLDLGDLRRRLVVRANPQEQPS